MVKKAVITAELERIRLANPNRLLTKKAVLQAAKNKNNPLHNWHGWGAWDKNKASYKFWLQQAGELIKQYSVVVIPGREPVPMYVSVRADRGNKDGGYRATTEVIKDK